MLNTSKIKAEGLVFLSSLCLAVMFVEVKLLADYFHWSVILFYRLLIGFVFVTSIALIKGHEIRLTKNRWVMSRMVCGTVGVMGTFFVATRLSPPEVLVLTKMSPIWLTVSSVILFGHHVKKSQWFMLFFAMAGVYVFAEPKFDSEGAAIIAGLVAGIFAGLAFMSISRARGEPSSVIASHFLGFALLISSAVVYFTENFDEVPKLFQSMKLSVMMFVMGITGALSQLFNTKALQLGNSTLVSAFSYISIPLAAVASFMVWHTVPSLSSITGAAMIVGSALWVVYHPKADRGVYITRLNVTSDSKVVFSDDDRDKFEKALADLSKVSSCEVSMFITECSNTFSEESYYSFYKDPYRDGSAILLFVNLNSKCVEVVMDNAVSSRLGSKDLKNFEKIISGETLELNTVALIVVIEKIANFMGLHYPPVRTQGEVKSGRFLYEGEKHK